MDPLGLAAEDIEEAEDRPDLAPFEKVSSNVKGFKGEIGVAPCTAFVGENETGKTAVLDAVRLALLGKHPAGLSELIPEKAESLFALVQGPAGSSTFSVGKSQLKSKKLDPPTRKGKLGEYTDEDLYHVMPTVSIGDMLEGWGATRTRAAVVTRFVSLKGVPTPEGMGDAQSALWAAALEELTKGKDEEEEADPTEVLAELRKWMHSLQLKKSKEKKHLEGQIEELRKIVREEAAGDELIPGLETQKEAAQKWEAQAQTREALKLTQSSFENLKVEAVDLNERTKGLEEQKAKLDALEARIAEVVATSREVAEDQKAEATKLAEKLTRGKVVKGILDAMVEHEVAQCPVCFHTSSVSHIQHRASQMAQLVDERQQDHASAQADHQATLAAIAERDAEVLRAKQAYEASVRSLENEKTQLRNRAGQMKARLDALQSAVIDVEYIGPSSAEIKEQIEALRNADAQKRQLEDLAKQLAQAKTTHEAATSLKGEAQRLLQETIKQISSTAEETVNKYMPEGFEAKLDLEGNGCEWRAVSRRDGRPHGKSASGAQKCALVIALALAWTEDAPMRILLVDDKELHGFSKANVLAFLTMVKARVDAGDLTQAFVAWSRPNEIPEDWMKVVMQ